MSHWSFSACLVGAALAIGGCQAIGGFKDFETGSTGGSAGDSGTGGTSQGGTHAAGGKTSGTGGTSTGAGGAGTEGVACTTSDACAGNVCLFGFCRVPCSDNSACPGSICLGDKVVGGCRLAGDAETMCSKACTNANLACGIDGSCRTACSVSNSCPFSGETCIQGACVGGNEPNWSDTWGQCSPLAGSTTCGGAGNKDLTSCNISKPGKVVIATCETDALCTAGIATGTCGTKSCNAGEYSCKGSKLQQCKVDETGVDDVADCGSPELCLKGIMDKTGMCATAKCTMGETHCIDGVLNVCASDLQQFTMTDCGTKQCDPGQGGQCLSLPIDPTEVTRAAYAAFLSKSPSVTTQPKGCGMNTSFTPDAACMAMPVVCQAGSPGCDKVPQVCVDWCDAYAFCADQGKHLCGKLGGKGAMVSISAADDPAQSTWMNTCSAGGQYEYTESHTWTSVEGQLCNGMVKAPYSDGSAYPVDGLPDCHSPVPSYAAVFDMSGNVAEWENSCSMEVTGPNASKADVCRVRGGSFQDGSPQLRCDSHPQDLSRLAFGPDIGFRCCAD